MSYLLAETKITLKLGWVLLNDCGPATNQLNDCGPATNQLNESGPATNQLNQSCHKLSCKSNSNILHNMGPLIFGWFLIRRLLHTSTGYHLQLQLVQLPCCIYLLSAVSRSKRGQFYQIPVLLQGIPFSWVRYQIPAR